MTRVSTSNYAGTATTTFMWATAGTDRFSRTSDLYYLAQALENHDHSAGKGLAVSRIANNAVDMDQLATGAVTTVKVEDLAITAAKLADLTITAGKIATDAVTTAKILDANVTNAKLATDAVTTAKITDLNVTTAKINDLAVTAGKLAADAVTTAKIADSNVTTAKIADSNVTTAKIADSNVTTAKIADSNVTTGKLADDAVTAAKLADDAVVMASIDAIDSPGTDEVLTYNGSALEWQPASDLVSAGDTIPSGLIAMFATAAAIATGWSRYTAADGRYIVGAGTAGSPSITNPTTFTENTNYGSNWQFTPAGSVTIVIATGTLASTDINFEHGGSENVSGTHTHGITSQTFTGTPMSWVIPSRALVYAQKD